jgi:hypothetical protein
MYRLLETKISSKHLEICFFLDFVEGLKIGQRHSKLLLQGGTEELLMRV